MPQREAGKVEQQPRDKHSQVQPITPEPEKFNEDGVLYECV
jgi:hypothetical protein